MPFGFLRRKAPEPLSTGEADASEPIPRGPREVALEGLTDEWHLRGRLILTGRLLDALNQREPMAVTNVEWRPADGSGGFEPAPGIHAIDPYDLVVVIASPETLAPMTEEEREAHRLRRVRFDVFVEAPPYTATGTIHLASGTEPEMLLERQSAMWFALTEPSIAIGDRAVELGSSGDAVLVNRFYMRAIVQFDRATGEAIDVAPRPDPTQRVPVAAGAGTAARAGEPERAPEAAAPEAAAPEAVLAPDAVAAPEA